MTGDGAHVSENRSICRPLAAVKAKIAVNDLRDGVLKITVLVWIANSPGDCNTGLAASYGYCWNIRVTCI